MMAASAPVSISLTTCAAAPTPPADSTRIPLSRTRAAVAS